MGRTWPQVCNYRHVRIALKPVTSSPSTADTSTPKSSGGSFLDILIQGTQDAVQPSKGSGSQTQSDAQSSSQNASDDRQSQGPSSPQSTSGAATPVVPPVKTSQTTTPNGSQQSSQDSTGTTPGSAATSQGNAAQNLTNLLTWANLTAVSNTVATPAQAVQTPASSTNPVAPSGKQGGATKGTQNKQDATSPANAGAGTLQEAMALAVPVAATEPLPQIVVAPAQPATNANQNAGPANGSQPVAISPAQAISANQAGSQIAATAAAAALTAATAAQNTAQNMAQSAPQSVTTGQVQQRPANNQAPDAQGQQSASAAATPGASSPFQHNLAALAATAANINVPDLPAYSNGAAQASSPKQVKSSDQPAANTFFSAALQQGDTLSNQTTAKVIPFKVAMPNLGANLNVSSTTSSSNPAGMTNAVTNAVSATPTSKNDSQDSSNSSPRDGQGNNDAGANTQAANSVARTADAGTTQAAALGTFTAAHAAAQSASTFSTADGTPAHVSASRNLPSEPANASVPAESSAINSARVIQSMNETEMRVGMRSAEFGDISIRTMVTQQQVQAQISVDHSELVSALAAHIPAAQAKIGADYGLHASIEVSQGGASFSNNQGQSSQRDYKPFTPSAQIDGTTTLADTERVVIRPVAAALAEGSRLDIRA